MVLTCGKICFVALKKSTESPPFIFLLAELRYTRVIPSSKRYPYERRDPTARNVAPARRVAPARLANTYSITVLVNRRDLVYPDARLVSNKTDGEYYTLVPPFTAITSLEDGFIVGILDDDGYIRGIYTLLHHLRVKITRNNVINDIDVMTEQEILRHPVDYIFEPLVRAVRRHVRRK